MRGVDRAVGTGLESLLAQARIACEEPSFKRAVLACCDGIDANACASRFVTEIHPNDQMFTHSLRAHRDIGAALSQYFNIGLQQYAAVRQLLGALFAQDAASVDVLDFACGYGRLLRLLTLTMPARRITAAELQSDALDFVARGFGLATLRSTPRADMFETVARFDFFWVASLFSHLPEVLFRSWLDKLYTLLTPRGVLCFSVRDEALLPPDQTMPTSGFVFFPRARTPTSALIFTARPTSARRLCEWSRMLSAVTRLAIGYRVRSPTNRTCICWRAIGKAISALSLTSTAVPGDGLIGANCMPATSFISKVGPPRGMGQLKISSLSPTANDTRSRRISCAPMLPPPSRMMHSRAAAGVGDIDLALTSTRSISKSPRNRRARVRCFTRAGSSVKHDRSAEHEVNRDPSALTMPEPIEGLAGRELHGCIPVKAPSRIVFDTRRSVHAAGTGEHA